MGAHRIQIKTFPLYISKTYFVTFNLMKYCQTKMELHFQLIFGVLCSMYFWTASFEIDINVSFHWHLKLLKVLYKTIRCKVVWQLHFMWMKIYLLFLLFTFVLLFDGFDYYIFPFFFLYVINHWVEMKQNEWKAFTSQERKEENCFCNNEVLIEYTACVYIRKKTVI